MKYYQFKRYIIGVDTVKGYVKVYRRESEIISFTIRDSGMVRCIFDALKIKSSKQPSSKDIKAILKFLVAQFPWVTYCEFNDNGKTNQTPYMLSLESVVHFVKCGKTWYEDKIGALPLYNKGGVGDKKILKKVYSKIQMPYQETFQEFYRKHVMRNTFIMEIFCDEEVKYILEEAWPMAETYKDFFARIYDIGGAYGYGRWLQSYIYGLDGRRMCMDWKVERDVIDSWNVDISGCVQSIKQPSFIIEEVDDDEELFDMKRFRRNQDLLDSY